MIGWVSIFALWNTRSGHQYYCSVRPSNNQVPFCLLYLYAHVKPVNAAASRASSSRPEITHYLSLCCGRASMRHASVFILWISDVSLRPTYPSWYFLFRSSLSFCLFLLCFCFYALVGRLLIPVFLWYLFPCPANHVLLPDWQPRILLGMGEAGSVIRKNNRAIHSRSERIYDANLE